MDTTTRRRMSKGAIALPLGAKRAVNPDKLRFHLRSGNLDTILSNSGIACKTNTTSTLYYVTFSAPRGYCSANAKSQRHAALERGPFLAPLRQPSFCAAHIWPVPPQTAFFARSSQVYRRRLALPISESTLTCRTVPSQRHNARRRCRRRAPAPAGSAGPAPTAAARCKKELLAA